MKMKRVGQIQTYGIKYEYNSYPEPDILSKIYKYLCLVVARWGINTTRIAWDGDVASQILNYDGIFPCIILSKIL